jgi:threonyl-tRNA synthetase
VDNRNEKLGYRMREAQVKKIPIQLVIGDGEIQSGSVNVRRYGKNESVTMAMDEFIALITKENADKA